MRPRPRAPQGLHWRTKRKHLRRLATFEPGARLSLGGDMPVKQRIVLVVAIALSGTTVAGAQTEEGRQACMNDAFQFCQDAIPDHERVFRCLESRRNVISAACRAAMPPAPAAEQPVMKKHAPPTKSAKRNATVAKSTSLPVERPALKKHAPQTRSATAKAPHAKRASNSVPRRDSKPLNLVPR